MKKGKTLLLIVVLIALSGYFYFYEVKGAAKRKLAEERKKKEEWRKSQVFPCQPQDLKKIRLFKDNKIIVYQKEEQVWWMKEPMRIKGDEKAVDDIIRSIIDVVETDPVIDNPSDLVQFGLDHPRMEISVQLEGEEETKTLLFGDEHPTSTTIYSKIKGSPRVFLVGTLIKWEVSKEFYNIKHQIGPFFPDKEIL
jgi:hypothetical protein